MNSVLLFSVFATVSNQYHPNNVCKELEAYPTILDNPKCWYDPDVGASAEQIAYNNGYKYESHQIITEDGYVLTVDRIPGTKNGPPVLILHGLLLDGRIFMLLKNESLVFYLSDQGYDVWVANVRGSRYSSEHVKYTVYDQEFWDFSFHEIGYYDVPAIIDYIKSKTRNNHKIAIIGHSMGVTVSFVYAATRPQHAEDNLSSMIGLAPVVYLTHSGLSKLVLRNYDLLYSILSPLSSHGIGENKRPFISFIENICSTYPAFLTCRLPSFILGGLNSPEIRPEVMPVRYSQMLSGVSFKTLIHYSQLLRANETFQNYDYGELENLKRYNSKEPQQYDLSKVSIPVHLFYGRKDRIADEKDALLLYNRLRTKKTITAVLDDGSSDFSHEDFLVAKSALKLYRLVAKMLK